MGLILLRYVHISHFQEIEMVLHLTSFLPNRTTLTQTEILSKKKNRRQARTTSMTA
jgi:hypothetical protein